MTLQERAWKAPPSIQSKEGKSLPQSECWETGLSKSYFALPRRRVNLAESLKVNSFNRESIMSRNTIQRNGEQEI
jgi:hypothetical protein